jgi:hypothetical protein
MSMSEMYKELQKCFSDMTEYEWDELCQEQAKLTESANRDYIESKMIEEAKQEDANEKTAAKIYEPKSLESTAKVEVVRRE